MDPASTLKKLPCASCLQASPLSSTTLYCSLEPCSHRASGPQSCTELLLIAGIGRVVVAWREPDLFVTGCTGLDQLRTSGVRVEHRPELTEAARAANLHLPLPLAP